MRLFEQPKVFNIYLICISLYFYKKKLKKYILPILLTVFLFISATYSQKLVYEKEPLVLKTNSLEDGLGQFITDDLPNVSPKNTIA